VSKTRTPHILPISLIVLGGEHAAGGVESSMRFIRRHKKKPVESLVSSYLEKHVGSEEDAELMPGFGPRFGTREPLYANLANTIRRRFDKTDLPFLDWALAIDKELQNKRTNHAIKSNGLAAAILLDLGFHPRFGSALMQWLVAPGLLAHGLEMSNKPLTAMPFVTDDSYHHLDKSEDRDD
jgi:citrate synthase